jgi:integrase
MARTIGKLSPMAVQKMSAPGLYGDGGGLWLTVGPTGGKSWLFRYMLNGRAREMGIGPLHTICLAEARKRAAAARLLRHDGIDPLDARQTARAGKAAADAAEAAALVTFRTAAERYIEANRAGWRNAKHAAQWPTTLQDYVYPVIGGVAAAAVNTGHVTTILTPIWSTKAETASRVRGRIESVLDYAKAHGWRDGENPARWRGHLENVLPAPSRVANVAHHAALPWRETAAFMVDLEMQEGVGAMALRFAILTAARTGEVTGATWGEIDMKGAVWTVPGARMKAGREHRCPLSDAAMVVLRAAAKLRRGDAVFPGRSGGLSNGAMLDVLSSMGRAGLTVHGFRSTFRDWAAETGRAADIAEAALAHTLGSKVQAAYQRGDLLERRRTLMAAWADWCGRVGSDDNVVAIRQGAVA